MRTAPSWLRYGVAVVAVALALGTLVLGALFVPEYGKRLGSLLFLAVLVSAWYGEKGPALFATGLISVSAIGLVTWVEGRFNPSHLIGLGLFIAGSVVITELVVGMRTARRRAEEEGQRLRAVLTSIGDAVITTDESGHVVFMNPVAEQLTRWDQAEAAGRPLVEVFPIVNEYTRAPAEDPVAKVLRTGQVVGLANHTVVIARDGTETPIDDSAAPIVDREGATRGVVLVFRDISERKRATEARERLAAIVDSSDDAIIAKTLDGVILSWNAGAERLFGYRPDEIVGQPVSVLMPADRPDDFAQILERIKRGERVDHYPTRRRRKDGTVIDVSLTVSPIRDASGEIVGASKIARDITEQKRTERLLREAKDAAEAANRAKDHFLAALSHELRTPLNPVLLALTAMLDDHPSFEDVRPTLEMIRHNVALEARLIDDLLDVMRIVRGKLALHPELVDAHELIRQSVEICQSELQGKEQRLTLDLSARSHHVHADPARLQQVFWNLIKNAVKFTPQRGTIALRTRNEPGPGPDRDDPRLVVEVADTGIGIAPDVLPRIFEAFEQGEDSPSHRYGGLGLGLAIGRSIVEAHGGHLTAASAGKGQGATFTLELATRPAPRDGAPPARKTPEGTAARRPLRILLVEDDETTLRLLARLLGGLGHEIATAANLAAARQKAEDGDFDLVISDIGLPDGSGLDLLRDIRARRAVPAIALTGYGMDEDVRRSQEAGFAEHLTKPINFRLLEGAIERLSR